MGSSRAALSLLLVLPVLVPACWEASLVGSVGRGAPAAAPASSWFPLTEADLGLHAAGARVTAEFPFVNPTGVPQRIVQVASGCACAATRLVVDGVEVRASFPLAEEVEIPPGRPCLLLVDFRLPRQGGPRQGEVRVVTTDPDMPLATLRVQGRAEGSPPPPSQGRLAELGPKGPLDVQPYSFLPFGTVPRGQETRKQVRLRSHEPAGHVLAVEGVEIHRVEGAREEHLGYEVGPVGSDGSVVVWVVLRPGAPPGRVRGVVRLRLNHPFVPLKEVFFQADVQ